MDGVRNTYWVTLIGSIATPQTGNLATAIRRFI
jgi:hypothetical protein